MPLEVFIAGEPDPHPPGTAVRRRLRAVPRDRHPWRTWLLPSVNGIRASRSLYDRHTDTVVGHAWIKRSALRRRRIAWTVWVLALAASIAVTVAASGPGHPDPAPRLGGLLLGLAVGALLLYSARVKAVTDPDDGHVGIRE